MPSDSPDSSQLDVDVFTGGVFMTNGYLIDPGPGKPAVIIDAPEGITDWLVQRGKKNVGALLLTHLHYDHVLDVAAMQEKFGCPVYSHSKPDDDLTLKSVKSISSSFFEWNVKDFEVDHLLAGKSKVKPTDQLGFKILHVPGHSPDSLCFQLRGTELLFGGDVLFQDGIGRSDFPHGDGDLLIAGIKEKILTLPDDTIVLPGHGPVTSVGQEKAGNPFLQ